MNLSSFKTNHRQAKRIRLRPVWLEEDTNSETLRFLNYDVVLPNSRVDATSFAKRFSNFNKRDERIMA